MVKTATTFGEFLKDVFDGFPSGMLKDRMRIILDISSGPFFGFSHEDA